MQQETLWWLWLRPSEMHPNCNISRVDTHCKHQLHCTECPFTGDDVYRRFIFNLLSAILMKRWIYEIQINKWINPLHDHAFFFVVWLLGDERPSAQDSQQNYFYSVLKEKNKTMCSWFILFVLISSGLWKEPYLINVSDHLYSGFGFISLYVRVMQIRTVILHPIAAGFK